MESNSWWKPIKSNSHGRWLALLKRKFPLSVGISKQLDVDSTLDSPAYLSIASIQTSDPQSIMPNILYRSSSLSGINMAGLQAATDKPTSAPEDQLWKTLMNFTDDTDFPDAKSKTDELSASLLSPLTKYTSGEIKWHAPLYAFQVDGVQAFLANSCLLLADDMGLGKTIQAIAALRILYLQNRLKTALIVVPSSIIAQWRSEFRVWAPELKISSVNGPASERAMAWNVKADVFICSYEAVRSDLTSSAASPLRRNWDVVVLDEAQRIKNRSAEVSIRTKHIPRKRVWALTGTPLENELDELASILEFLSPFEQNDKPVHFYPNQEMLDRHKAIQLRRKKREVLSQLPPITLKKVSLQLTKSQLDTYRRAEDEGIISLKDMGRRVKVQNILELITKLKQICNFCSETGESAKADDLHDRLRELSLEGNKALIFSQFIDKKFGVQAIANRISEFRPLTLTGEDSPEQKTVNLARFKTSSENKALVLSLRAGGVGLNLQEASYVFLFDSWWNPATLAQAIGRSDRIGQISPVNVYRYVCAGTIEERIEAILERKAKLFADVIDSTSIEIPAKFSNEELFGLFSLTPP